MKTKIETQAISIEWDDDKSGWNGELEVSRGVEGVVIHCKTHGTTTILEVPFHVLPLIMEACKTMMPEVIHG